MSTRERLVMEASSLLDAGGEAAVTLRAVGHAVGVSHNAPYRHFKDRGALLAAIAERDFKMLTAMFEAARTVDVPQIKQLERALHAFIQYGRDYPARYRLLFSDPAIGAAEGSLEEAALGAFTAFAALVGGSQDAGCLPTGPTPALAELIYATTHGLIGLETSGRMREQKGFSQAEQGLSLLVAMLETARGASGSVATQSITRLS